jgi:hypothetical protein
MRLAVLVVAGLAGLAACNPYLTVRSPAPPGRTARLDQVKNFWGLQRYRLELSRGVAIAMTCEHGGPCEHMRVVSDDPAIAEVRTASLGVLQTSIDGEQTAAALVIVGKAPGQTRVHVREKDGSRDVLVTVVAAPAPATPLTAAR